MSDPTFVKDDDSDNHGVSHTAIVYRRAQSWATSLIKMVEKMTDHTVIFKKPFGAGRFWVDETSCYAF